MSVFLFKLRRPVVYTLVPMAIMLLMSIWAMLLSLQRFWLEEKWSLAVVSVIVLAMSLWLIVEAILSFCRGRDAADLDGESDPMSAEEQAAIDTAHLG